MGNGRSVSVNRARNVANRERDGDKRPQQEAGRGGGRKNTIVDRRGKEMEQEYARDGAGRGGGGVRTRLIEHRRKRE